MRTNLSLHMITADDLEAGGGAKTGLYVAANDGQISFGVGRVALFFDGPAEFAGFLTKLNQLAADTPCVVEAMNPPEPMPYYPVESFGVSMGCDTGSVFDSCEGDRQ